jgi:hypothetical protein
MSLSIDVRILTKIKKREGVRCFSVVILLLSVNLTPYVKRCTG